MPLVFLWVNREVVALSFAVTCAFGVRVHHAPRLRTFDLPPPAHSVACRRRGARAPRGRAPCRHNSTSQQRPSCVLVSGFAAVGVRNSTGDRGNSHAPLPWRSRLAHSARLVEAECVFKKFDLHATVTKKTPFLARIWLSELHHAFPRYPTEREKAGTNHPRVPTPPRRRWRALGD